MELGTIDELRGRRSEAKVWYERLISDFSDSSECLKAEGALRRLELPGREMFLALPLLFTENERVDVPFDLRALRGKPVIVYCWASWDNKHSSEINELKAVIDRYPSRGVELLCVNLDSAPDEGRTCWSGSEAPGVHVFQRDGLNGAWAKRYGIMTLPFVIVVGRDGKVATVNAPVDQIKNQIIRAAR